MKIRTFQVRPKSKSEDEEQLNSFLTTVVIHKIHKEMIEETWHLLIEFSEEKVEAVEILNEKSTLNRIIPNKIQLKRNKPEPKVEVPLNSKEQFYHDYLKLYGHYLSDEYKVPFDRVLTRNIIKHIIRVNPTSMDRFAQTPGMNSKRFNQFGIDVFRAYKECSSINGFEELHKKVLSLLKLIENDSIRCSRFWDGKMSTLQSLQFK